MNERKNARKTESDRMKENVTAKKRSRNHERERKYKNSEIVSRRKKQTQKVGGKNITVRGRLKRRKNRRSNNKKKKDRGRN